MIELAGQVGYPMLVLLVAAESAGLPVPGETALISAALLAGQHRLQIGWVVVLAASAAIVGDNLGYLIGRKGGRWILGRPGPFSRQRGHVLEVGEPFFARHGAKAVAMGRWVAGLRTWASWLAGANRMPWRSFLLWNALGGVSWATAVGLIGYFGGHSVTGVAVIFSVGGLLSLSAIPIALLLLRRSRDRTAGAAAGDRTHV